MDELPRGVYALDYPQTENGVILISYTWGEDSSKLLGLAKEERFALFKRAIAQVSPEFAAHLVPVNGEILNIDWQATDYHHGAFKLQYPGQEQNSHDLYYQFLSVLNPATDRGVYLAGDSVSWSGGWIEGALQTGINAACAAAKRIGACLKPASPLSQNPNLYNYDSLPIPIPANRPASSLSFSERHYVCSFPRSPRNIFGNVRREAGGRRAAGGQHEGCPYMWSKGRRVGAAFMLPSCPPLLIKASSSRLQE